eukprot:gene18903-25461_t
MKIDVDTTIGAEVLATAVATECVSPGFVRPDMAHGSAGLKLEHRWLPQATQQRVLQGVKPASQAGSGTGHHLAKKCQQTAEPTLAEERISGNTEFE